MRLSTPSALVALLGTSVSGNILSTQAASCNSEPISTGRDSSLEQLNSATREACAKWSKNDNTASTFNSAAFNLSFDGATGTTGNGACVSAFANILNSCASDVIFGGSITSQGVKYTIDAAETDSDSHSKLAARLTVKPTNNRKPNTGTAAASNKNPPAAASDKGTAAAPNQRTAAANKKHPACKKVTRAAYEPAHGPLRARALLLDLIRRNDPFSGHKKFKFDDDDDKYLVSDAYPPQGKLVSLMIQIDISLN
jgi:hypothetical protein